MLPDRRETRFSRSLDVLPIMVEIQRSAMVDKVQFPVPAEEVRIAGGPVNVGNECIEPHRARSQVRLCRIAAAGSNITEPGR